METVSEKYNKLPIEVREICSQMFLIYQIRDLEIEKDRAIRHHRALLKQINNHIDNCKRDLIK